MKKRKRIAIFGGSFNPVHNQHVEVVKAVLENKEIDQAWILPCKNHSFNKDLVDGNDRVKMIELAFSGIDNVVVCLDELNFDGKSYTYDTIARLKNKFPNYDFYWVSGSDVLYEFDRWYKYKDLSKEISFIIFEREGYSIKAVDGMNVFFTIKDNINDFSSTQVRERIKKGVGVGDIIDSKVESYIKRNEIYKN